MIVVTGATGHFGRSVVEKLSSLLPASEIGISARDPEKASPFARKGIRVRKADFTDPSTLPAAFEGAEQILIVSVNALGDQAIQQHGNAIRAARDAGVRRILYTSHQAASPTSHVAFARDHAATEALLAASGVPFVSLRNGFYAESSFYQLGGMRHTGTLALPGDGPVSWTVRDDLAAAAVAALTLPGLFDGITPPLTAGETLTFAQIAQLATEILDREIRFQTTATEAYRQTSLAHGYPGPVVDMLLSMFQAIDAGEFNVLDPTLERVLGRKPTSYRTALTSFLQQPQPSH